MDTYIQHGPFRDKDRLEYAGFGNTIKDTSVENYKYYFDIDFEECKGKKYLDIGGVVGGQFAKKVLESGGEITTLGPRVYIPNEIGNKGALKEKYSAAHGYMQDMQGIQDNIYDRVYGFAVVNYLPPFESEWRQALSEVIRVLRPGGQAKFNISGSEIFESQAINAIIESLKDIAEITFKKLGEISRGVLIYLLEIKKHKKPV